MTNQDTFGYLTDGSPDPEYRHADGRMKDFRERQDHRTKVMDAERHVLAMVKIATDKVRAREPNVYRSRIADVKRDGPGYMPSQRADYAQRLERLEAAADAEDLKLGEINRLETIAADPLTRKQLESIEGLRAHAVGDEVQAIERAKALAMEGLLSESETELTPVMDGVCERLDAQLRDSRDRAHVATRH